MTKSEEHFNKMNNTPISRLILSLGLPSVISMLITNIYNLADTYFVGRLGVSASAAVGVTFTLMVIIQAFGFMFGHGAGNVVARKLAQKDTATASVYLSGGFFGGLAFAVIFSAVCLIFIKPLMLLFGSTDTILPFASKYSFYILLSAPALVGSIVLNNCLRYEGLAVWSMIGLSLGGLLNIGGDPLFIYVFHMGISGAGVSTCISQYISFIVLIIYYRKKAVSSLSYKYIPKKFGIYCDIVRMGFPNLLRQGLTTLSTAMLNNASAIYGDACVSAMSIVSRCQGFMLSIAIGVGQGFQPVAGFCYQLKEYKRLKKGFYFTLAVSSAVLAVFCLTGFIFSSYVIKIFQSNAEVIKIGAYALKVTSVGLMFIPLCIVPNMMFQSAGLSGRASLLSSLRGGLCFIPVLLVLSHFFGMEGIQLSRCISDIMAASMSVPIAVSFFVNLSRKNTASAA